MTEPTDAELAQHIPIRVNRGTVTVPSTVAALGVRAIYDMVVSALACEPGHIFRQLSEAHARGT